ncbi:hypothetical protein MLD38_020404 [Melastoma candidum]|uniref:Uncharacterized protein n=1 Tax=Melastoma candidum TaxID=119954 RepID=A0ACB9QDR7_9MYRT|nr:hypothetical protein MLD38_020404 [Melastoma candidum]
MGKKSGGGGWFSAIKRAFTPGSKEKLSVPSEPEKRALSKKDKRKGYGQAARHGEAGGSYIPFFREPSSIEKILGDAEREHRILFDPPERARSPPGDPLPRGPSPVAVRAAASPRQPASPRTVSLATAAVSPRVIARRKDAGNRRELTFRDQHVAATVIQAAYRGYVARRSFRALKGLVRLQEVVRGQNVKRQTANALKSLQLLVRVQSQIQSRRIQMLENQVLNQTQHRIYKDYDGTFSKWSQVSDAGNQDEWDDSLLTKEEIEARLHRKVEAVMKRERAMAYAYSNQLWKPNSKSPMTPSADVRTARFPWWWSWLDRRLPSTNPDEAQPQKNFHITPPRAVSESKPSPWTPLSDYRTPPQRIEFDNISSATPRSTRSVIPMSSTNLRTPSKTTSASKYLRSRVTVPQSANDDLTLKDDDSLTSCPAFSVPNYMAPTVSAKAKVRPGSNPRERFPKTPTTEGKKRFSFSLFSGKNAGSTSVLDKRQPLHAIGNVSFDSTVSLPAGVGTGRKPFNRFV